MSTTFQYRKKPVVIEAFQWTKEFVDAMEGTHTIMCPKWLMRAIARGAVSPSNSNPGLNYVYTNTGNAALNFDDWIIFNPETEEIYPCSDADFKQGFAKVEEA